MRISTDKYFLELAKLVAQRGTCTRRQVGCVLINKQNHIISTGYNGVPSKMMHCVDTPCEAARLNSGMGLDECKAIHAESNAVAHCSSPYDIYTAYCTVSPCINCIKLLAATTCERIMFLEEYPHIESKKYWTNLGRNWLLYYER